MYETLFLGNKKIKLEKVDSTNTYLKELLTKDRNSIEGLVVIADYQQSGRGQRGNSWQSEPFKNITFSLLLKPNIAIGDQFMVSKMVSLGVVDFLEAEGVEGITIKWPNDIYVQNAKIAGILIENVLKGNSLDSVVVGIGLNINQIVFDDELMNVTSLKLIQSNDFDLDQILNKLLFFIEQRYLMLKNLNFFDLNKDYLEQLFRLNKLAKYEIKNHIIEGEIVGVTKLGKLQINIDGLIQKFDLKEVKFVINN